VVVPTSTGVNPAAQEPSHLQQVHAELLAELPVPDASGSVLHTLPALHTTDDYTAYINERTAAWKASRRAGPSST
jgi:phospholipase C